MQKRDKGRFCAPRGAQHRTATWDGSQFVAFQD